ncbi:5'-nucleotidase, lipoprotein e(P4) family [Erwinia pyrifoliae]|uniref:5'-nucleotidase, lipoprotein e(P4) family n=1 Tax=Erwinia pyrifoliae TaxID=79967 RepID=A0ABY5XCM8_ERWPY|nr:5'-nucleotidase, lipoprotein e(P4) family [Erwinia pyrifoliae]AUX72695.1 5'-nucleotidase, lipoprotein e(P4) family [Erwinia pyrifoliae]MCA8877042.1 5'-nucleotidase, lipoprotein e(P4) family [Erwinia pyrifoliae]MCT2387194.1 5'-nucleotidase, lipoprotein e(P4) family [Erwinia pyrifoliae]MCU8587206.1 5'-nucleotidase, lipoprotein e(P4) family [Erwinia pyrifoliae]UWS31067.1 5'-nucleotidase, lipoprotein e(P4) family [Erwinia pyrifoliae]
MHVLKKAVLLTLSFTSTAVLAAAASSSCPAQNYEMALRYQQKSAEVMALQLQTYRFAQARFDQKLGQLSAPEKAAIVLDLDETVIDNSALLVRDAKECHDYTQWDTWDSWEKHGNPRLIPGAKAFLENVNNKKVRIFYVSDRFEKNKAQTMATLKKLGLPQVSEQNVLLDTESKEKRRAKIMRDYQIIMLLGDSLPDFAAQFKAKKSAESQHQLVSESAAHFGDDWFVLPNSAYGAWSTYDTEGWKEIK